MDLVPPDPPPSPFDALRAQTTQALHDQLDAMLAGPATAPDGSIVSVLDDICIRQLHGFGFSLSVSVAHPNAPGRAVEDPSVTAALAAGAPSPLVLLP